MIIACHLNPVIHAGRFVSCFGSYGWSAEGVKNLAGRIAQLKVKTICEPLSIKFQPNEDEIKQCIEFGIKFGEGIKA